MLSICSEIDGCIPALLSVHTCVHVCVYVMYVCMCVTRYTVMCVQEECYCNGLGFMFSLTRECVIGMTTSPCTVQMVQGITHHTPHATPLKVATLWNVKQLNGTPGKWHAHARMHACMHVHACDLRRHASLQMSGHRQCGGPVCGPICTRVQIIGH